MDGLFELKLHETMQITGEDCEALKVPHGWIYIFREPVENEQNNETEWKVVSTTFVRNRDE